MEIEIIPFTIENKLAIKTLNEEWLTKYFELEPSDIQSLTFPKEEIIDKGGFIFYAKMNGEIVGTYSFLKKEELIFELGKMAVKEGFQGFGIGKILLEHAIEFAKNRNWKKLILFSNTKLQSAIHIYKKYNFKEVYLEKGLYKRADIKMELNFVN